MAIAITVTCYIVTANTESNYTAMTIMETCYIAMAITES